MFLISAQVGPYKSINESQAVSIEDDVTVFVGMNEAGKTVFLQALQKSEDALTAANFDPVEDYPRKDLPSYLREHKTKAAQVTELTYRLTDTEVVLLNAFIKCNIQKGFTFSVLHYYDNKTAVRISVDEQPVLDALLKDKVLSSDALAAARKAISVRNIPELLNNVSLTEEDKGFLTKIEERVTASSWESVISDEAWKWIKQRLPKFLYFSDYELLPSKMNLADLASRVQQLKNNQNQVKAQHRAVLALLRMADIEIADFTTPGGYETLKAKIEGISINLTDQIMEFWKQNEDLEVEVDIKTDPEDEPPFDNGPNLYLRIKNRRHRGVSTPFHHRSRGFVWFFSFLVWFDSVQHQLESEKVPKEREIILLLDEPGLSLHALAQDDFLRYIDDLTKRHQVLYTTHSPFMVHADRLHQVRVVEDKDRVGTVISDNVTGSDPRTIFPLQAALGWTIAQNLFITEQNLLVEGPSDLIYLKSISTILEAEGRTGLREDITIVPTGGLDKVVTFIALLGANGLKLAVLHDFRGTPEQKLMDLVKQKMISPNAVLNPSQFRDPKNPGVDGKPSDTEDLFTESTYLKFFNKTFAKQLNGIEISDKDLPPGDRIIGRLERYIKDKTLNLRPSGGFNHYAIASHCASHPPNKLDSTTMQRFEALFKAVNSLF